MKKHEQVQVRSDLFVTKVDGGFLYEYYKVSRVKFKGAETKRMTFVQAVFVPEEKHYNYDPR